MAEAFYPDKPPTVFTLTVFSQYMVKTETIDLSGTGVEYSIADAQYQRECDIIFQGEYTQSKLIGARFEGDLYIDGIAGLEIDNSVTISFSEPDTFGTPLFRNKIGAYQGTQIHSIFIPQSRDFAIILIYDKYSCKDNRIVASFDPANSKFICIGDIDRQYACELISDF